MALDGIMFEGVSVRVRRPNDYNPAAAAALGPSVPNPALNLAAIGLQGGGMGGQVGALTSLCSPALLCIGSRDIRISKNPRFFEYLFLLGLIDRL